MAKETKTESELVAAVQALLKSEQALEQTEKEFKLAKDRRNEASSARDRLAEQVKYLMSHDDMHELVFEGKRIYIQGGYLGVVNIPVLR